MTAPALPMVFSSKLSAICLVAALLLRDKCLVGRGERGNGDTISIFVHNSV